MDRILVNKQETRYLLGGISARNVDYLIKSGQLKPVRIGRRVFLRYRDVLAFARADDHPSPAKTAPSRSEAWKPANEPS